MKQLSQVIFDQHPVLVEARGLSPSDVVYKGQGARSKELIISPPAGQLVFGARVLVRLLSNFSDIDPLTHCSMCQDYSRCTLLANVGIEYFSLCIFDATYIS